MKYYIEITDYTLHIRRKRKVEKLSNSTIVFESTNLEEAIKFYNELKIESYKDIGQSLSNVSLPAYLKIISLFERNQNYLDEPMYKYLERINT
jgi:hypothetical protein